MDPNLEGLETRIVRRRLAELKPIERNAHFMKGETFNQLVANIKRDGVLTSLPVIHQDDILSGNHRVRAAMKAGLVEADVIEILSPLSESRRRAIQLSHNSIVGDDDPTMLRSLYEGLDLGDKLYSGLDDTAFGISSVDLASLSAGKTELVEILLVFLPEHAEAFKLLMERIGKAARRDVLVAPASTFDVLFDTLVQTKERTNIYNTAMAMLAVVKLASERLAQMEAQAPSQEDGGGA